LSAFLACSCGSSIQQAAYPIKIENAVSFDSLYLKHDRLTIRLASGTLSIIETERGITGAGIVAPGIFSYRSSDPEPGFQDSITAVMLRFNPDDYEAFVRPANPRPIDREEAKKQSSDLIKQSFARLYHKGSSAIFPDAGVLGAVLLTNTLGNLVVGDGGNEPLVYSLAERKYLFRSKETSPIPKFQYVSDNWMKEPFHISLTSIWQNEQIPATGESYYYLPVPTLGKLYSQRFDPTSRFFQCWFGVYVLKPTEARPYGFENSKPIPQHFIRLAMADQRAWLQKAAGVRAPQLDIDTSFAVTCAPSTVAGKQAWRIAARLHSNVDVGENNRQNTRAAYANVPNAAWLPYLDSYASVLLDVVFYVVNDGESKATYVIYYNGVEFVDKLGERHHTLPEIDAELQAMASSISF
jgi:hypothetical protein